MMKNTCIHASVHEAAAYDVRDRGFALSLVQNTDAGRSMEVCAGNRQAAKRNSLARVLESLPVDPEPIPWMAWRMINADGVHLESA